MSRERQAEIAASQLAKKLKLEAQFKPTLYKFFYQISRDVNAVWIATGNIPSLNSFQPELIALLRAHYRRIAKAFSYETRNEARHCNIVFETKKEDNIDRNIVDYINQHSVMQAGIIMETTQRDLQTIAAQAITVAYINNTPTDNETIGSIIKTEFDAKADSRVTTIATTETQIASERIKFIEAQSMAIVLNNPLTATNPRKLLKTWNTILDEKTRHSHVLADRQEHGNINEPFLVQGEMLMIPGDTSLGATIANIINCRCASITHFSDEVAPIMLTHIPQIVIIE